MVSFMLSTLDGSKNILLFAKSHANLVINTSCILLYPSKALYIECNHRLQELLLGVGVQADYNVVHLRTSLVQLFVLLLQNFEKVVQMIELKRFGGAPNGYLLHP
jgi:hypothetical protein